MRILFLTLVFSIQIVFCGNAQIPPWQWALTAEGTSTDKGMGIATDADGNMYCTGFFYSSILTFGSTVLTKAGNYDIFLVKYDGTGNVLWAKSYGSSNEEKAMCIATDASGNVFIAGHFLGSSLNFGINALTNNGNNDMFVAKLDSSGNALWARSAGGADDDEGYGIATDINGNVFVSGYFYSSAFNADTNTLINVDSNDIFIVKYDSSGNVLWAKAAGGSGSDYTYNGIATDAGGNLFITGWFSSPLLSFDSIDLSNAGKNDIFIAKYDPSGNVLWAKPAGGINEDGGYGIATDANGNALLTGYFSSSINFDSTTIQNNTGMDRVLVLKCDSAGALAWAKSYGGNGGDRGFGIATDDSGNVFVSGFLSSENLGFGSTVLHSIYGVDVFVAKFNSSGNALWAKSSGGGHFDFVMDIAVDATENAFITGYFYSDTLSFDSTDIFNSNTGVDIYSNLFAAKIGFSSSSVAEEIHNSEFELYPNPAHNQFYLSGNFLLPATLELFDITGRKVFTKRISDYRQPVNISALSKGFYLYQLKAANEKIQGGKLIRE